MSIRRQVQRGFFLSAVVGLSLLICITIRALVTMEEKVSTAMTQAQVDLEAQTSAQMLEVVLALAESKALLYAEEGNADFVRLEGELDLLKSSAEQLYANRGLAIEFEEITRYEDYIVAENASISQEELGETITALGTLVKLFDTLLAEEQSLNRAYLALGNGVSIAETGGFYGELETLDFRQRDWYLSAVEAEGVAWSDVYLELDTQGFITVSCPVYHNGQVFGVLALDLDVEALGTSLLAHDDEAVKDNYIFGKDGDLIFATQGAGQQGELWQEVKEILLTRAEKHGSFEVGETIIGYAEIPQTSWKMISTLNYDMIHAPVEEVSQSVTGAVEELKMTLATQTSTTTKMLLFLAFFILLYQLLSGERFSKRITGPILTLEKISGKIGRGNLEIEIPDLGTGEIGNLARDFQKMTEELQQYIENLSQITAEKERASAELAVATNIQASMLPFVFPAFPERGEFDLHATMTPAKEVGGDFYDFFLLDEDHLALSVADVSGKGIPAALFMVISKTLLKNTAQTGKSPKEVLELTNNMLCEGNIAEMFVTVWFGIYEISTGRLTAANAGHEYPVIKRKEGDYALFKDPHGVVLAGLEHMKYKEYELTLEKGDTLFVYTDGVAEATNKDNQLYGTERLLTYLNSTAHPHMKALLEGVKGDVDLFVAEAPQFDDITMLGFYRNED